MQSHITEKVAAELETKNEQLKQLTDDLNFYVQRLLDRHNHHLEKFEIALKHLNPDNILKMACNCDEGK
ncbi:MAG: hypothetical protein IPP29_18500 [Bacteroidetes bacterium]|nr:hypothetical protein [Bacteroidota bacterium]